MHYYLMGVTFILWHDVLFSQFLVVGVSKFQIGETFLVNLSSNFFVLSNALSVSVRLINFQ